MSMDNLNRMAYEREMEDQRMRQQFGGAGSALTPNGLANQIKQGPGARIGQLARNVAEMAERLDEARRMRQQSQETEEQCHAGYCKAIDELAQAMTTFRDGGLV